MSLRQRDDLTGKRFGRLTVIGRAAIETRQTIWTCLCDCGVTTQQLGQALSNGHVRSCGCTKQDVAVTRKHMLRGAASAARRTRVEKAMAPKQGAVETNQRKEWNGASDAAALLTRLW